MFRKLWSLLPSVVVFAAIVLLYFTGVSHAATAVAGQDASILDYLKPVYDAFAAHQFSLMAMLIIILLVAAVKRYLGDAIPFLHTDAGGSLLVLVGSAATAAAASLSSPSASITLDLMKSALIAGFVAAGGWVAVKNLLVDPFLKPLAAKAPAWAQPIFNLVLWVFDHGADAGAAVIATAEKAGDAAVVATPATGVAGVVGSTTELP